MVKILGEYIDTVSGQDKLRSICCHLVNWMRAEVVFGRALGNLKLGGQVVSTYLWKAAFSYVVGAISQN